MTERLDYDLLQESFVFLLVLAFFVERSLAVVFELTLWRGLDRHLCLQHHHHTALPQ